MNDYTFDGDYVPVAYDTDPDYFDLSMPDPLTAQDAEKFLDWMEWQQSLVPDLYKGDPWQIYDLEGYQAFITDYISIKAAEDYYGKSIHTKDRPFIS
jgi:hypothetical protein